MMKNTDLSRRSALAAGLALAAPAAAAVALPVVAGSLPVVAGATDPIFALIDQHKAAWIAFDEALGAEGQLEEELPSERRRSSITSWDTRIVDTDDPRWIAALWTRDETCDEADRLAWAMLDPGPTTIAGMVALLRYIDQRDEESFPHNFLRELPRRAAGMLEAIAAAGRAA